MPAPTDDKMSNVQTVDNSGNPVSERVATANAAWDIYDRIKRNTEQLALHRALIKAQQAGNAPYAQDELDAQGLGWMSNVNFGRARATVRLNSASIWNMFTSVPLMIDPSLNDSMLKDPQEPSMDYASIIAEEYTRTLLSCPDFYYNLLMRIREMALFGNGPAFWEDEWNWKSKSLKTANFMYPPKTEASPTGLELCCIRDEKNPRKILHAIADEEAAKEEGWNIAETKRVLTNIYKSRLQKNDTERYQMSDWESVAQYIKNLDFYPDLEDMAGVQIVHMLVAEIDTGEVTHMIFYDEASPAETDGSKKAYRAFMYKRTNKFPAMLSAVSNLLFEIGDGYLRSVRGLAFELYPTDDIGNRVINSVLDGVMMVSGLLVQPQTAGDMENMHLIKKGPVTMVPEGLAVIQSSFAPPIDKSIQALDLVNRIQNNNAGVFRSRSEDVVGREPRSATQVEIEAANEARFEGSQSAWYYVQWDLWHRETFRRLINPNYHEKAKGYSDHKEFVQRLKDREIPESMLNADVWDIKASRAIGMGSPVMAQRLTAWLLSILPLLDERGKLNAKRDAIMVRFGPDKVDRYAPLQDRDKIVTSEHTMASLENNDFINGQNNPAGSDQPHKIHLVMHLTPLMAIADKFRQDPTSIDPVRVATYMQIALQHSANHIEFLAQDHTREKEVKDFQDQLMSLLDVFKQIAANVQRIQKEKQKRIAQMQQQLEQAKNAEDRKEIEIALHKARMEQQVKLQEAKMLNESRIAKMEASIEATVQKAMADVRRKDFEASRTQRREDLKAASKIRRDEGLEEGVQI